MAYQVDFKEVTPVGLASSPVKDALAGLRANEARYFWNKYHHVFVTRTVTEDPETVPWVDQILAERDLHFPYPVLEVSRFEEAGIKFADVFYENGLVVSVMYALDAAGKRAVGFKLADGMAVPVELADNFKFARQKSKLAGTIRGSYFVIKGTH